MLYLLPSVILLCIFLVSFVDWPLAMYCKAYFSPDWVNFFNVIAKLGEGWLWYLLVGNTFLLWRLFSHLSNQRKKVWQHYLLPYSGGVALRLLVAMASSAPLVEGLKIAFGRARPRLLFECGLYGFNPFGGLSWTMQSFPSGHSQTIWVVMTALALSWPSCRWIFITIGGLVSVSRVVTTAHYLSDVVMGTFLGITVLLVVHNTFWRFDRDLGKEYFSVPYT